MSTGGKPMKFVDRTKLQVALIESGMSIKDLAEELCISYGGAYHKIKGYREFTENEIFTLSSLFGTKVFFMDSGVANLGYKYGKRNSQKSKSS